MKSCPKSNILPNLITLASSDIDLLQTLEKATLAKNDVYIDWLSNMIEWCIYYRAKS